MPSRFALTEPHPSVPKSGGYIYGGGRGGAGNYKRYEPSQLSAGPDATGPASHISLNRSNKRTMAGGRGGAGNMFQASPSEIPMFQFDEELKRREHVALAPIYHVGRGGAANFVDESKPRSMRAGSADSGSSASSVASRTSLAENLSRLVRKVSKH